MAKPHDISVKAVGSSQAIGKRSQQQQTPQYRLKRLLSLCLVCAVGNAMAQNLPPAVPTTTADQAQRRAQDRDRALREQQDIKPDVRLTAPSATSVERLPIETPCFVIQQLSLEAAPGDTSASSGNWGWALDAAAGPQHDDSPQRKCVGANGVNLILKRIQEAVIARGFVTTRVVVEPQDLASGALTFTALPGRIHAIRFASSSGMRSTGQAAIPARPGDILNLRDIEQGLENFKRVPTAEADIRIESPFGTDAGPGQSDLVINYAQGRLSRFSVFADDSGSQATGKYQGGVNLSGDNWLGLNDLFYISLNHDLGGRLAGERGTHGGFASYSVPWGYWLLVAGRQRQQQPLPPGCVGRQPDLCLQRHQQQY